MKIFPNAYSFEFKALLRVKTNKYEDIQPILPKLYSSLAERPLGKLVVIEPD